MNGKRIITTIGGGTGQYTLLSGLKHLPDIDLAAIVAMTDDGGSTGKLRDELGVLPPGDLRQCLVALSDVESDLREMFEYRYTSNGELNGHSLGNLIISAFESKHGLEEGLKKVERFLQIKGNVIPITFDNVRLHARTIDGRIIIGEHEIDKKEHRLEKIYFRPEPTLNKKALERIIHSDLVVLCPGDVYTSILPNLLVSGVAQGLALAKQAPKKRVVYVCNIMTQRNHTDGFGVRNFVETLHSHVGNEFIDVVLYNTRRPDPTFLEAYGKEGEHFVEPTHEGFVGKTLYIGRDILSEKIVLPTQEDPVPRSFVRHDSQKTARAIEALFPSDVSLSFGK